MIFHSPLIFSGSVVCVKALGWFYFVRRRLSGDEKRSLIDWKLIAKREANAIHVSYGGKKLTDYRYLFKEENSFVMYTELYFNCYPIK